MDCCMTSVILLPDIHLELGQSRMGSRSICSVFLGKKIVVILASYLRPSFSPSLFPSASFFPTYKLQFLAILSPSSHPSPIPFPHPSPSISFFPILVSSPSPCIKSLPLLFLHPSPSIPSLLILVSHPSPSISSLHILLLHPSPSIPSLRLLFPHPVPSIPSLPILLSHPSLPCVEGYRRVNRRTSFSPRSPRGRLHAGVLGVQDAGTLAALTR